MKTIEVSDEVYAKLIELANEMTAQDPRGTRMPHMFQIRDWKKVYDWGLNGDTPIWIGEYQEEIETLEDFKDYLESNGTEYDETFINDLWNDDRDFGLPDWIEENCHNLSKCSYSLEPVYINHFLTAKSANEHLKANYYHYHKDADVYLNHAWRNPEMELVSEFLCNLINKKLYT